MDITHVLIVSGGMDSATLAYQTVNHGGKPLLLTFDYGQKHKKEIDYARILADDLKAPHKVIDLSSVNQILQGSALTDDSIEVPEGHYASDNMASTVVPNRNAIMLSVAYGAAVSLGCPTVGAAMHAGDHAVYPDCRPEFTQAFNEMERIATEGFRHTNLFLWVPYIDISKAQIAEKGIELGIDYSRTWSCYKGGELHCGVCGTCVERREAFALIGADDPTRYAEKI